MPSYALTDRFPLAHSPQNTIPRLGFGVYLSSSPSSALHALKIGYRHIDTAQFYQNEREVGEAVRASGINREEVFVTTKIMTPCGSVEKTLESLRESVERIGLGYVDLFLIHSPSSGREGRREMWEALERLREEGGTRCIGVSNFGVKHLEQLKEFSKTVPVVNQIEIHPWCQQREIVDYCKKEGIVVEAYAPLVRARKNDDPTLVSIAKAHSVTPSQVLLHWSLQHDLVPLPKSDTPSRIEQNADVFGFELTDEDMKRLDDLALPGGEGAICPYKVNCE